MRVALHVVKQRRKKLRSLFRTESFLPLSAVCRYLGVSEATARRDLAAIAAKGHITRTRGGGVINHTTPSPAHGLKSARDDIHDSSNPFGAAQPSLRITLRDIAEKTGFAKTTVSLSLRNNPKIPVATREIVRSAAKKLGYRPDPALARIAEHRWRTKVADCGSTIAFITTGDAGIDSGLDGQTILGARSRAAELGYGVEHFQVSRFANPARLGNALFHRGIRGIIVGCIWQDDFCEQFPWNRFSSVGCNVGLHRPPVNIVVPDKAHAVARAWQYATTRGFKRIGIALTEEKNRSDMIDRMCASVHCLSLLPLDAPKVPILQIKPDDRVGFLEWIELHSPDLVLGSGAHFVGWLQDAGYRLPEDLGFASLIVDPVDGPARRLAGMECNMQMIGCAAVEQLDILIRTNQIGIPKRPFAVMVESNWVDGETAGIQID